MRKTTERCLASILEKTEEMEIGAEKSYNKGLKRVDEDRHDDETTMSEVKGDGFRRSKRLKRSEVCKDLKIS